MDAGKNKNGKGKLHTERKHRRCPSVEGRERVGKFSKNFYLIAVYQSD